MNKDLKDKIRIAKLICDNYATGEFTIESCCDNAGICQKTFNTWVNDYTEITDLYKKAKELKRENDRKELIQIAESSFKKKLKGWTWTETTTEAGKLIKTVDKFQVPDTALLIFALCNLKPDDWKNTQNIEHSGGINIIADWVRENDSKQSEKQVPRKT